MTPRYVLVYCPCMYLMCYVSAAMELPCKCFFFIFTTNYYILLLLSALSGACRRHEIFSNHHPLAYILHT
ncbi:hypothetical protein F4814DRAFT_421060 [Daldinia grandis]|nr:hypothetical protein F4814DRAFT_421060 [Daldinia grandis]